MKMSVSFVLGKASGAHSANVDHNNRKFVADNIDSSRTYQNITYVKEDIQESYEKLFGEALKEYNDKQKQPCRRIDNYYERIKNSKREEAFYEAIVQFGDRENANCLSENGELAKQMLDEYMKDFQQRNPNLYVFNAVMHLDEESPHLHIDFIPYYTKGRVNGLSQGVSMKSALIEQGFIPKGTKMNQLVAWELSERKEMERILNSHNIERENKDAHYKHMSDSEYKEHQDYMKAKREAQSRTDLTPAEQNKLTTELYKKKRASAKYESELRKADYKSFYYSSADKQAYVEAELDKLHIPYRETQNGLEAQECFAEAIRDVERKYRETHNNYREQLRDDIDRAIAFSKDAVAVIDTLQFLGYEVKMGKYLSIKPEGAERFIRIKSLGADYTEQAIALRINARNDFEKKLEQSFQQGKKENKPESYLMCVRTIQLYTAAFKQGKIPVRRKNPNKALTWKNDSNISALLALNEKFSKGVTLEQLHQEMEEAEKKKNEIESKVQQATNNVRGYTDINEKALLLFEGVPSTRFTLDEAKKTFRGELASINDTNYKRVALLIENEKAELTQYETELKQADSELKEISDVFSLAEKVLSGAYVTELTTINKFREASEKQNGKYDSDLDNYRTW